MELRKSDYESYDYRKFWQDNKRGYEDFSERKAIRKLLKNFEKKGTIADIGCGFGRLFNEYNDFDRVIMLDYSVNNLKNAREVINDFFFKNKSAKKPNSLYFIAADAERIPIKNDVLDMVISVRLMHHLNSPERFINEVQRILKEDGCFILEFANKRNLKNILKFFLGRTKKSPFSSEPLYIGETIRDYHPKIILRYIKSSGLKLIKLLSVSNFRISFLKTKLKPCILTKLESISQVLFSSLKLGPSIFVKSVKKSSNLFTESIDYVKNNGSEDFLDISEILVCPACGSSGNCLIISGEVISCGSCGKKFKNFDGIYDLRNKSE
ncbi:class I SAM-dependent methyltransferase [bacterium]|nr:class I SAM-dependent methyltransferase [bacterium]